MFGTNSDCLITEVDDGLLMIDTDGFVTTTSGRLNDDDGGGGATMILLEAEGTVILLADDEGSVSNTRGVDGWSDQTADVRLPLF